MKSRIKRLEKEIKTFNKNLALAPVPTMKSKKEPLPVTASKLALQSIN